jgi:hypothetical protein
MIALPLLNSVVQIAALGQWSLGRELLRFALALCGRQLDIAPIRPDESLRAPHHDLARVRVGNAADVELALQAG